MTREEREAAIKYFELFCLDCSNDCELCPSGKDCKAYTILDANKFAKLAIEALKQPENIQCEECKFKKKCNKLVRIGSDGNREFTISLVRKIVSCSYGERRSK